MLRLCEQVDQPVFHRIGEGSHQQQLLARQLLGSSGPEGRQSTIFSPSVNVVSMPLPE